MTLSQALLVIGEVVLLCLAINLYWHLKRRLQRYARGGRR